MPRIEVHNLQDLAERTTGKTQLGELVRRLIYATVAKNQPNLHFLSGETNGYAGWDGWVEVSFEENGTIKQHRSVWELSTDRDFEAKFKRDAKSARSKPLPNGWVSTDAIYVGVTLRSATPQKLDSIKKKFLQEHGSLWAGIVLLAADDIVQWLEKMPSVEDWVTEEFRIGTGRFGRSLEHWFAAWSGQTTPSVTERLLTSGRDLSPLLTAFRLDSDPVATLQCDSVEEAIALVHCATNMLLESERQLILSSTLVVSDETSADRLVAYSLPPQSLPTIVLSPPATRHRRRLTQAGYRVIQALGRVDDSENVIQFERANVREFADALESSMGIPSTEAETQARASGSSVSIWHIRNLFLSSTQLSLPEWVSAPQVDAVVAAVFSGSWHEQSQEDTTILVNLAGMGAAEIANCLAPFATCTTPLIEHIGSSRMVIAPTAAFEFISRKITRHHIERLSSTFTQVFREVSPAVQARWSNTPPVLTTRSPRAEVSDDLRDGLAETLLKIAVLGVPLAKSGVLSGHSSAQGYVDHLVRSLPGLNQDARVLASLDHQLPVLFEAAPLPFLDALDALIRDSADQMRLLLSDESGIFGRSFHTGMLWGLESLAWSPEYLPRVAKLLASLDQIDAGGRLSNRPFNSLCEIFLPWHPGTSCEPQQRYEILARICERLPEVGWKLILELLPGQRRTSTLTHRPKWRDLGQIDRRTMLLSEVHQAYELTVELAFSLAGQEVSKLADLALHYAQLSSIQRSRLEMAIRAASDSNPPQEELQRLWARLDKLRRHHSSFPEAPWALPSTEVQRLHEIVDDLNLMDPALRHRWLFDEQFPDLGDRHEPYETQSQKIHQRRQSALREILEVKGWDGIHELISSTNNSHIVGSEVGFLDCKDVEVLRAMDVWQSQASFSAWMSFRSASSSRERMRGIEWTNCALSFSRSHDWPAVAVAMVFIDYPDSRQTYDLVQQLSEEEKGEYWTRRYAFVRGAEEDIDAFRYAVEQFLIYKRAVDLIDQNWHDLPKLDHELVIRVVDSFIAHPPNEEKAKTLSSLEHDLQHIFDWLREQKDVPVGTLARREYQLLPLLTDHGIENRELSLHQLLRDQPEFFAEVVSHLYKPASGEREPSEGGVEAATMRAHAAFELLGSWRTPPGVEGVTINRNSLATWVDAARSALMALDRARVGDQTIGKVLYYLPVDSQDGAYPPHELRDLLEQWQSEDLERGIRVEAFNSRGVTSRALYEGGKQEHGLANHWRATADKVGARWPRAQALCRSIAEMWSAHAASEDLEARTDRARQSR